MMMLPPTLNKIARLQMSLKTLNSDIRWLETCAKRAGDIVRLSEKQYLVSHPDYAKAILTQTERGVDIRRPDYVAGKVGSFWGKSLPVQQGEVWLDHRRILQPLYQPQAIEVYLPIIREETEHAINRWADQQTIHADAALKELGLRIAVRVVLGTSDETHFQTVRGCVETLYQLLENNLQLYVDVETPEKKQFQSALAAMDTLLYEQIALYRGENAQNLPHCMLAELAQSELSDTQLRDEMVAMFRASHKNNAITLTWTLYLLTQHPDYQARLRAKKDGTNGRSLTTQVLAEAMRLYPLYPTLSRRTQEPCEINGYHIPADVDVTVATWTIQRDARFFDAPTEFRPARWTPDFERQLPDYAYFPFGGGARLCNAKAYALLESDLVLRLMLHNLHFTRETKAIKMAVSSNGLTVRGGLPLHVARL